MVKKLQCLEEISVSRARLLHAKTGEKPQKKNNNKNENFVARPFVCTFNLIRITGRLRRLHSYGFGGSCQLSTATTCESRYSSGPRQKISQFIFLVLFNLISILGSSNFAHRPQRFSRVSPFAYRLLCAKHILRMLGR